MAAPANLAALAKKKWSSSGLTDAQAKKLRFEVLTGAEVARLDRSFQPVGSLKLPYFDEKGKPTKFYRLRYLEPLPGFAGQAVKPQRYAQPAGTLNEVYLPPLLERSWAEIFEDVETTIYITEGELKSGAGASVGLAVMGLGGVDMWRAARREVDLLPALRRVQWEGRRVVIVYDSDAATNENVVRAQRMLAQRLLEEGAVPAVASLPPTEDGAKQGLDDFLVANGAEALEDMLDDAVGFAEAAALWEMNEEVSYITDPGLVVVRGSGQVMAPQAYVAHAYANRHYLEVVEGQTPKRKPTAKRWIEWERRFTLRKVTYLPGQPQITEDACWNTWKGWGCEPKPGNIKPWKELLDFLFQHAEAGAREWFERWCAYPLQHPGTKLFTSVVIWGTQQGTGKSLAGYTLKKIYGENGNEIGDEDLRASFNEWAVDKQFIVGEEVTGEKPKAEADRFKRLITQSQMRLNKKYVPSYSVPDCINYYFSSNHPDAFFLDDTDRRFFIHEVVGESLVKALGQAWVDEYDRWYGGAKPKVMGEGIPYLFHHLLNLDLGDFNPRGDAFSTRSKQNMIADNKSDMGAWCASLREDPVARLRGSAMVGDAVAAVECDLWTPQQLWERYGNDRVTVNGLSRELKRSRFRQVKNGDTVRVSAGCVRLYIVRHPEKWVNATDKQIAEHYDKFFGPRKPVKPTAPAKSKFK